jgi:hypothetical protein
LKIYDSILAQNEIKPVEIGKSIAFNSKILNETRTIQISMPESYENLLVVNFSKGIPPSTFL